MNYNEKVFIEEILSHCDVVKSLLKRGETRKTDDEQKRYNQYVLDVLFKLVELSDDFKNNKIDYSYLETDSNQCLLEEFKNFIRNKDLKDSTVDSYVKYLDSLKELLAIYHHLIINVPIYYIEDLDAVLKIKACFDEDIVIKIINGKLWNHSLSAAINNYIDMLKERKASTKIIPKIEDSFFVDE